MSSLGFEPGLLASEVKTLSVGCSVRVIEIEWFHYTNVWKISH